MISRFMRRLMGTDKTTDEDQKPAAHEDYKGVELRAMPIKEGSLWRVAGTIAKAAENGEKQYDFVRADTFSDRDTAARIALDKARRLVDQMGDKLFE